MARRELRAVREEDSSQKPKDRMMIKTKFHLDVLNAIQWISDNDNPSLRTWANLEEVAAQTSVKLVAKLFGFSVHEIAFRVIDVRTNAGLQR